jgi:hypothetical protein
VVPPSTSIGFLFAGVAPAYVVVLVKMATPQHLLSQMPTLGEGNRIAPNRQRFLMKMAIPQHLMVVL